MDARLIHPSLPILHTPRLSSPSPPPQKFLSCLPKSPPPPVTPPPPNPLLLLISSRWRRGSAPPQPESSSHEFMGCKGLDPSSPPHHLRGRGTIVQQYIGLSITPPYTRLLKRAIYPPHLLHKHTLIHSGSATVAEGGAAPQRRPWNSISILEPGRTHTPLCLWGPGRASDPEEGWRQNQNRLVFIAAAAALQRTKVKIPQLCTFSSCFSNLSSRLKTYFKKIFTCFIGWIFRLLQAKNNLALIFFFTCFLGSFFIIWRIVAAGRNPQF